MEGYSQPCYKSDRWVLIPYLVKIFLACLATGSAPAKWCQVKVLFKPKPSRDSYGRPKYFRPISLTSLLKAVGRLVERFLRDEILALIP
jgi:hypothetical protein